MRMLAHRTTGRRRALGGGAVTVVPELDGAVAIVEAIT
jgi:hypothetical protein